MNSYKRGEIYYIDAFPVLGHEQRPGRPAVIVSNNKLNKSETVLEVVYLTTKPKAEMPTHVTIRAAEKGSVALCEQITTVDAKRVGAYMGKCSESELCLIDIALSISLALEAGEAKTIEEREEDIEEEEEKEKVDCGECEELIKLKVLLEKEKTKSETIKGMYNELLDKMYYEGE